MENSKKIELNSKLLLAKGGERFCYLHPFDNTKVIKITPDNENHKDQNNLDYHYYQYLHKSNKDLRYITKCFGFVETNLGKGLVFTRVLNYDGTPSHSLKYVIFHEKIEILIQKALLKKLFDYLWEQKIVFGDVYCDNIFCKEIQKNHYEFIIIDGLGAKRLNYKYKLYLKWPLFRNYKIIKQARKMVRYHEEMILEAEATDPKDIVFYK